MLKGIGASEGYGIGRVMVIAEQSLEYTPKEVADVDAELERFHNAIDVFCDKRCDKITPYLEESSSRMS